MHSTWYNGVLISAGALRAILIQTILIIDRTLVGIKSLRTDEANLFLKSTIAFCLFVYISQLPLLLMTRNGLVGGYLEPHCPLMDGLRTATCVSVPILLNTEGDSKK